MLMLWKLPDGHEVECYTTGRITDDYYHWIKLAGRPSFNGDEIKVHALSLRPAPTREPTGQGAVVRSAHGHIYVRHVTDGVSPHAWWCASSAAHRVWHEIAQPVEVLSEGWTE